MAIKSQHPVGEVVLVCYFIPILAELLFLNCGHECGKWAFIGSIAVTAIAALCLFFILKKWEYDTVRSLSKVEKEKPKAILPSHLPSDEAKKYKEEIKELQASLEGERERVQRVEREQSTEKEKREELQAELQKSNAMLTEKSLALEILEKETAMLKQENSGLQKELNDARFEIKTLLKVNGSSFREKSSRVL
jgi:hypothetical protein